MRVRPDVHVGKSLQKTNIKDVQWIKDTLHFKGYITPSRIHYILNFKSPYLQTKLSLHSKLISKRITNYTFCPMHWSLDLNRSKVNKCPGLESCFLKGQVGNRFFFQVLSIPMCGSIILSLVFFVLFVSLLQCWTHWIYLFTVLF